MVARSQDSQRFLHLRLMRMTLQAVDGLALGVQGNEMTGDGLFARFRWNEVRQETFAAGVGPRGDR